MKNIELRHMKKYKNAGEITDSQLADYIFDDLSKEEKDSLENHLMKDDSAYSTSLELLLLTLEKGFSKVDLLAFLRKAKQVKVKLDSE